MAESTFDRVCNIIRENGGLSDVELTPETTLADAGLDSLARVMGKMEANHTLDPSLRPYIQSMDGYTPTIFYDLGDYAAALCADQALLAEFEAQMRRTVPYKGHTQQYYSAFTGPMPIRAYSGLTTSAPTTSRYADDWAETQWYKATHQP